MRKLRRGASVRRLARLAPNSSYAESILWLKGRLHANLTIKVCWKRQMVASLIESRGLVSLSFSMSAVSTTESWDLRVVFNYGQFHLASTSPHVSAALFVRKRFNVGVTL